MHLVVRVAGASVYNTRRSAARLFHAISANAETISMNSN
jgi:hypothetical protein